MRHVCELILGLLFIVLLSSCVGRDRFGIITQRLGSGAGVAGASEFLSVRADPSCTVPEAPQSGRKILKLSGDGNSLSEACHSEQSHPVYGYQISVGNDFASVDGEEELFARADSLKDASRVIWWCAGGTQTGADLFILSGMSLSARLETPTVDALTGAPLEYVVSSTSITGGVTYAGSGFRLTITSSTRGELIVESANLPGGRLTDVLTCTAR